MKKRSTKLHITIDNLPTGLDNGSIMDGSGVHSSGSITSLIGITIGLRRRKNFSLILLAGLSALLCALYYTSYYPGTVWTLRLGVTSFSGGTVVTNNHQGLATSALTRDAGGFDKEKLLARSAISDGSGGGSGDIIIKNSHVISSMSNIHGDTPNSHHQQSNINEHSIRTGEGADEGGNPEEISAPQAWNWKYWASLEYWKVNFSAAAVDDDNDDDFSRRLSGKPAGGGSVPAVPDFPSAAIPRGSNADAAASAAAMVKVPNFHHNLPGRLACNFPRLNPFDPSITEFIKSPPDIDCTKSGYPLVFRTDFRNKLIQRGHPFPSPSTTDKGKGGGGATLTENYSCCYKTITRGNGSDHNIIFSKRCYPIVKVETVIPSSHEFISVRCRTHIPETTGREHKGPFENNKETSNGDTNNSGNNGNNNNNTSNNNINNTNTAKVYKDMLPFVPLKPWVEDRIRKYEESKRKLLYVHKKVSSGNNNNSNNKQEKMTEMEMEKNTQLEPDTINKNYHETHTNEATVSTAQYTAAGSKYSDEHREDKFPHHHHHISETMTTNEDRLSVVVLGLDAQSHMNFIRQMPQTYNFLTKNLSSIGMYGYTKVGDNTFPNVVSLLSGFDVEELEKVCWPTKQSYFDSCPFIWKKFAESGYRTSLAEDAVWMGTFNYEKKGFLHPPTDYYLHPLSLAMAKKVGHETWANAKLCYGPRLAFEVLLDYMVKTAVTFRDSLYFQFVWANSLFHDYLNNPRLGDELLYLTLEFLRNNGFLNNTAFILLSDHGIRWGSIRSTYQGKIEERMPLAYLTFPSWFRHKYPLAMRNLGKNVLRLTTPFDVYETLLDILRISQGKRIRFDRWYDSNNDDYKGGGNDRKSSSKRTSSTDRAAHSESDEKLPRGISMFRPIPLRRTCKMAGIEEHWCVCHSMQSVPINSTLVQSGAQFIVQVINGLVRKHGGSCAKLVLFKINEAKRKIDGDIDRGLDVDFLFASNSGSDKDVGQRAPVATPSVGGSARPSSAVRTSNLSRNGKQSRRKWGTTGMHATSLTIHKNKTDRALGGNILERLKRSIPAATTAAALNATTLSSRSKRDESMISLSTTSDIKKMIQLQITLVTRPGDAVFEATIYGEAEIGNGPVNDEDIDQEAGDRSNHHWKLSGDISRLNLYGSQSACVSDYTVQKYCYCHNLRIEK